MVEVKTGMNQKGKYAMVSDENGDNYVALSYDSTGRLVIKVRRIVVDEPVYHPDIDLSMYRERIEKVARDYLRFGAEEIATDYAPEDIRTYVDRITVKVPMISTLTRKEIEYRKKKSKQILRAIKGVGDQLSYEYYRDFKILKRAGDKRVVSYIYGFSMGCEPDCPYIPKAMIITISALFWPRSERVAKMKMKKLIEHTFGRSRVDWRKVAEAIDYVLGESTDDKKLEVKCSYDASYLHLANQWGITHSIRYKRIKVIVPKSNRPKDYVLVLSLIFSHKLPSDDKKKIREVIKKYLRLSVKEDYTGGDVNVAIPLNEFIRFASELTGFKTSEIKKNLCNY